MRRKPGALEGSGQHPVRKGLDDGLDLPNRKTGLDWCPGCSPMMYSFRGIARPIVRNFVYETTIGAMPTWAPAKCKVIFAPDFDWPSIVCRCWRDRGGRSGQPQRRGIARAHRVQNALARLDHLSVRK